MKINALSVILITSLFAFSCKKDQEINLVNTEFQAVSITKDGALKVYTDRGQKVTDLARIQKIIEGEDILWNRDKTVASGEKVKFVSVDSVYFLTDHGDIARRLSYKTEGTKVIFSETFTERLESSNSTGLYTNIVKYKPLFSETFRVQGIGGLHSYRKVTNTIYANIYGGKLTIYQFAFKLATGQSSGAYSKSDSGIPMNQFNDDFLKSLTAQDILAVQSYTLNFNKLN